TASPSAWTARAPGGTTSSSSGSGAASNTRRYILEPTTASARLACRSAATWTFITAGDRIRALTARHPIKPISASCRSAWQPNLGRRSTYRCGNSVQTTGTTSLYGVGGANMGAAPVKIPVVVAVGLRIMFFRAYTLIALVIGSLSEELMVLM